MKSIEKKFLTGAIAASFLLGGAGFLTQANAQATTNPAAVDKTAASDSGAANKAFRFKQGPGGGIVQQTATLLGVDQAVISDALKQGKTLAQIAQDKGLSEDVYIQKLVDAQTKAAADGVAAGKFTQAQADKMTTGLADRLKKEVERTGLGKGFERGEGKGKGEGKGEAFQTKVFFKGGSIIEQTAAILNVDQSVVTDALKQGKTLVQIAQDKGVSADAYLQKLVEAETKAIADAVTAGKLTQAQADIITTGLADRLKQKIENNQPFEQHEGKGGFGPGLKHEVLAQALGMTPEELKAGLQAGSSLAELAQQKGITEDQLIAKLKDGLTEQLKQFVQHKKQPQN